MAVGTSNYPTSTDTTTELVEAANNAADTLGGAITAISTSLTLADSTEFTNSGIVAIDNELLSFTGKSGNTLTGLTRGIEGTTAASHSTGAEVKQVISAKSHNVLASAIIALENKLGTGTDIAWSVMAPLTASRVLVTDGAGDVTVSGVTSTTLSTTFGNQTANTVFAGPTTGSAASPAFRSLVAADIPALSYGDVTGPSTATDNAIVRFDTTTGKLIQNSLITLSDAGALSFPDGVRQTFNPNGTNAGINVGGHTSDPSSATNGDLWYNSTANQLKTRRGATTEVVATIPSNLGDEIPVLNATTGNLSATGEVFWDGSGNALQVGNASTGALRLVNATGTDSFTLLPPASGGAVALTLPPGIGSIGQALTSDGTGGTSWSTITAGVSSVSGTSPVVSSGGSTPAISLASGYGDTQNPYASKTANHFLAAPNGTAGVPTFRAIVAADIPTLNQNTTGTASNVTGTVAIANGGTGQTTQQAALNALAGAATSGQYLRGNGTNVVMSAIQASDVPTLNQNTTGTAANVTGVVAIANGGTGQTTRQDAMDALAGAVTAGQYLRGNGTDVVMSAIQVADVPTLNQNTTGTASNVTGTVAVANGGTGQNSYTNGQLLIGNTATGGLSKTTLTAGSNVTITNGNGTISIAAAGGGREILTANRTYYVGFLPGTAGTGQITVTSGTPATITCTGHALAADTPVIFTAGASIRGGTIGSLPAGIVEGATYYVRTVLNANQFTVSYTLGGTAISTAASSTGSCFIRAGNDGSTGLNYGASATGALLTVNRAIDLVASIDLGPYNVTIQLCKGRYVEQVNTKTFVGAGPVTIQGNPSIPQEVYLSPHSGVNPSVGPSQSRLVRNGNIISYNGGIAHGLQIGTPIYFFGFGNASWSNVQVWNPQLAQPGVQYYVSSQNFTSTQFSISATSDLSTVVPLSALTSDLWVASPSILNVNVTGQYNLNGLCIGSNTYVFGIRTSAAYMEMTNMDFWGPGNYLNHIAASNGSFIYLLGSITLSQAALNTSYTVSPFQMGETSTFSLRGVTMTLVGSLTWFAFLRLTRMCTVIADTFTFSGPAATGMKIIWEFNSTGRVIGTGNPLSIPIQIPGSVDQVLTGLQPAPYQNVLSVDATKSSINFSAS